MNGANNFRGWDRGRGSYEDWSEAEMCMLYVVFLVLEGGHKNKVQMPKILTINEQFESKIGNYFSLWDNEADGLIFDVQTVSGRFDREPIGSDFCQNKVFFFLIDLKGFQLRWNDVGLVVGQIHIEKQRKWEKFIEF